MGTQQPFMFEHDGIDYEGYAWEEGESCLLRVGSMSHVRFQFDAADNETLTDVRILLPTDKLDATPAIACTVDEFPFLGDAIKAARTALIPH